MKCSSAILCYLTSATLSLWLSASPSTGLGGQPVPTEIDRSEVRFSVGESALLDWLRAVTPHTFTVGNDLVGVDLTLSEPRDLVIENGRVRLSIRLRGRTIPVDQMLKPVITVEYEPVGRRYYGLVESLPVRIPGIGRVDLSDSFPRFPIPALLENFWEVDEEPMGLTLRIRRIAILEHRIEVGADVDFTPLRNCDRSASP